MDQKVTAATVVERDEAWTVLRASELPKVVVPLEA